MNASDILNFWFVEINHSSWWKKDHQFDKMIINRFSEIHKKASACELYSWRETPQGRLAEIIILDQFSRNMFRDKPEAFAQDPLALALAQEAVHLGCLQKIENFQAGFLIMPYMHSESLAIHDVALELFKTAGSLEFEKKHRNIIVKFGRYPHRNKILGRQSTPEEIEFLNQPGSSF